LEGCLSSTSEKGAGCNTAYTFHVAGAGLQALCQCLPGWLGESIGNAQLTICESLTGAARIAHAVGAENPLLASQAASAAPGGAR
jgi:hypothetical protein